MNDFSEALLSIKDEIGDASDGGVNEALLTPGKDRLNYGNGEAKVEVNSRTVYLDLSHAGGMATKKDSAISDIENMIGIPIDVLKDMARDYEESGSLGGYRWSLRLEIPTETLLDEK